MMRNRWGALLGALLFFCNAAAAAGISVNPIRIELEGSQRTGSVTVSNDSAETKVLQATVMQWKQTNDGSVYEPTKEVIATPVLFRLAPRSQQLLRVGFPSPPAEVSTELSYRIYLTEVPEDKGDESQIRFLLRLGIPMFVAPAKPQDDLRWQISRQSDGTLRLTAENRGNQHVRLQKIQLEDGAGLVAEHQSLDYLLAGSRQQWSLTPARELSHGPLQLKAQSGRGELKAELSYGAD